MADDAGDGDDEREWRFSVDEVGEDTGDGDEADTLNDEDGNGGVAIGDEDDGPTVTFAGPGQAAEEVADAVEDEDEGEDGGNVAGTVTPEVPVETDTPDLESALFVGAGALLVLLVFASIATPLTPQTIGAVALGVAVVTASVYAVFVRF